MYFKMVSCNMLTIDQDKCTACGLCEEICPCEAISHDNDIYDIDPELCVECDVCVEECPAKAIKFKVV